MGPADSHLEHRLVAVNQNTYVFKALLYVDIFVCALVWRDADITISSMTGLELRKPKPRRWARVLGWVLNHLQPGHCEGAIAHDIDRAETALQILKG